MIEIAIFVNGEDIYCYVLIKYFLPTEKTPFKSSY